MKSKMQMVVFAAAAVVFAGVNTVVADNGIDAVKFDPKMAMNNAVVDTNGVKWIDGKYLPIEGRVFGNVDHYYDRLPSTVTTNVNAGVRSMKHHTSGMQFRFKTSSKVLHMEWVPYGKRLEMDHMPSTGVSGIDIYRFDAKAGKWRYVSTGRITDPKGGKKTVSLEPGTPVIVNLPLYNGIKSFRLGIEKDATISALPPRKSGIVKPVVFYGTSITHGGCCSRPGLAFVNIIGRRLDVPVVNLGFSGSGRMEYEMSEHLAAIDASCYVLDCVWNMGRGALVPKRYEPFIRNLRAKRPGVPIIMAGRCDVFCGETTRDEIFIADLYKKLKAEGWKNLYYLPKDTMYSDDFEGTVDGCHPNDHGMMSLADAYGKAVKQALKLK